MVVLLATATDRFYIEDFTIAPGKTCTVSIMLDNETAYTAFQTDIYLPAGLSIEQEDGDYIFDLTSRKGRDHNIAAQLQVNGAIRIMSYSPTIKAYSGNSGALVTFNVTASEGFEGPAIIALRNTMFTTTSGTEVVFDDEVSAVTVPVIERGDANADGFINITDATELINYLLTDVDAGLDLIAADCDFSGNITIADVTELINYLLTNQWSEVPVDPEVPESEVQTFTVNGVSFKMVTVDGGTFMMGATPEQGENVRENEKPVHEVTLKPFIIGQTEVTQELWQAVMGSNPSHHTGDMQRPVDMVSWVDCQEFITRLNQLTGKTFRLPTEAEWEYAARGGNKSQGYRYAGSNDMLSVAWCSDNSENTTHPVATKAPNELGLHDMTGNVWEWCNDWYARYTADPQVNPAGPDTAYHRVLRGGCWNGGDIYNRISYRDNFTPTGSNSSGGLRLAMDNVEVYTVNGVSFTMVPVKGGTFTMGATVEEDADYQVFIGSPQHQVTLTDFSIGQTEVTQELWQAVMGSNPSQNTGDLQRPVESVNWFACDTFIMRLNALTGKNFRLQTEAEWEYAAKGGSLSRGFTYSGSDNIDDVAWYLGNSDGTSHPVATKAPNELGLYDMNGNVSEWCNDWFYLYTEEPMVDPTGPVTGGSRVHRGGRYPSGVKYCRLTRRDGFTPVNARHYLGLRLALKE